MNKYQDTENRLRNLTLGANGEKFVKQLNTVVEMQYMGGSFELQNVAECLHLTQTQLRRYVQAYLGMPPAQYIMYLRLRESLRLFIEDPNISITEISKKCGFFDHSHFTHTFMRYFGMTPRRYVHAILQTTPEADHPTGQVQTEQQ